MELDGGSGAWVFSVVASLLCLCFSSVSLLSSLLAVAVARARMRPSVEFEYMRNEQVSELGPFGIHPWGSASGFRDRDALWVWPEANAHRGARAHVPYDVQYLYDNPTGEVIAATVHAITDDVGQLYVNEQLKGPVSYGWWHPNYPKIPIELQPGANLLRVRVTNTGGPAGLILSVLENGSDKVLVHTDSTWRFALGK